jgi:ubiquinone/menaquinone biosynthesis C-methylase UbiE
MDPSEASRDSDRFLSASVFDVYDELLVPLMFQTYADDVVRRLTDLRAGSILEVAAGTGAVTRAMAHSLPAEVTITATDVVQGMVDRARRVGTARPVTWDRADVMALPYESGSFDVVVCQFGAMFFDPKPHAFAEARRVLRPGGHFLFSVWDGLEHNEFAAVVNDAVKRHFPEEPPRFLEHMPYGYHERAQILADLRAAGFDAEPAIERVEHVSRAGTPGHVAVAFCLGTPLRDEIERRGPDLPADAIAAAAAELAERFGAADLKGRISAQVVTAVR